MSAATRHARSLSLRTRVWLRLLNEYSELRRVYQSHETARFFIYGSPCRNFENLAEHPAYQQLAKLRRGRANATADEPHFGGSNVRFVSDFPVLPTYLPIEEGAGACLGVLGLLAADLFELRGGQAQTVRVRQSDAGLSTAGYMFLEVEPEEGYGGCNGFEDTIKQEGVVNPVRKAYVCRDGTHIFLHGGFPKLKQGLLDFLHAEPTVDSIGQAVSGWDGASLESAMRACGLAVTMCRTPADWRESDQGRAIASLPPVCIDTRETSSASGPRLLKAGVRPLSDVVVVDFSHVIASPMVGRTLAEHGAIVFKVVTSLRPRRHLFDEETNNGKHTIELDLNLAADRDRLWNLLGAADVLVDGYTNGVLARFGFDQDELFARCPHLVYLRVSCYGHIGPWTGHKGFQQNANFATGVATIDDEALLCYQLTSQVDYTTGFLGAMGAILALTDRQLNAQQGRSTGHVVHTSLCQAAMWMSQFGARMPTRADYIGRITRLIWGVDDRMIRDGNIRYLPPAISMSRTPPDRVRGFHRWWNEK